MLLLFLTFLCSSTAQKEKEVVDSSDDEITRGCLVNSSCKWGFFCANPSFNFDEGVCKRCPYGVFANFQSCEDTYVTVQDIFNCKARCGWVGWQKDRGYLAVNQKKSFREAEMSCRSRGGHLATAGNQYEFEEMRYLAASNNDEHTWIGLTDHSFEGEWRWLDATPWDRTQVEFGAGQPDNYGFFGEDCGSLDKDFNYAINDLPCDKQASFLCEFPEGGPCAPQEDTRITWNDPKSDGGFVIDNWYKAKCREGMKPILDEDECVRAANEFYISRGEVYGDTMYIDDYKGPAGCHISGDVCSGRWQFNLSESPEQNDDFTPICKTDENFCIPKADRVIPWNEYIIQDWDEAECDQATSPVVTVEECEYAARSYASLRNESEGKGLDFPDFGYLVREVSDDGPSGCQIVGDLCNGSFVFNTREEATKKAGHTAVCMRNTAGLSTKGYLVVNKLLTFPEAEMTCQSLGGSLASARDRDEWIELRVMAKRHAKMGYVETDRFWIGLHDNEEDGEYVWTDGSPFDAADIDSGKEAPVKWADPKNNCLALYGPDGWDLSDFNCLEEMRFVCRLPYALKRRKLSFQEAELACQEGGGHLASASTKQEFQRLKEIAEAAGAQPTWIGLNDREREKEWKWTDGTTYNKKVIEFDEGEPNNFMDREDCAAFLPKINYKLNDWDCNKEAWYICKFEKEANDNEQKDIGCGYEGLMAKTKKRGKKFKRLESPCECKNKCIGAGAMAWTFYTNKWKCACFNDKGDGAVKVKKSKHAFGSHKETVKRGKGRI